MLTVCGTGSPKSTSLNHLIWIPRTKGNATSAIPHLQEAIILYVLVASIRSDCVWVNNGRDGAQS